MNSKFPKVGEVWLVNIPKTGDHRIYGVRPAIIVSHSRRNCKSPIITVIPLSRYDNKPDKLNKSIIHTLLETKKNPWLKYDSIVLCEQETPCDISCFKGRLGELNSSDIDEISVLKIISQPMWFDRAIKTKAYEDDRFISSLAYM